MSKTIKVANVRLRINEMLRSDLPFAAKQSLCCIIEDILFQTDTYKGFSWNLPYEEARDVMPADPTYYNRHYF